MRVWSWPWLDCCVLYACMYVTVVTPIAVQQGSCQGDASILVVVTNRVARRSEEGWGMSKTFMAS